MSTQNIPARWTYDHTPIPAPRKPTPAPRTPKQTPTPAPRPRRTHPEWAIDRKNPNFKLGCSTLGLHGEARSAALRKYSRWCCLYRKVKRYETNLEWWDEDFYMIPINITGRRARVSQRVD